MFAVGGHLWSVAFPRGPFAAFLLFEFPIREVSGPRDVWFRPILSVHQISQLGIGEYHPAGTPGRLRFLGGPAPNFVWGQRVGTGAWHRGALRWPVGTGASA